MKREYFKSKNEEELKRDADKYAKDTGIKVNPDKERVQVIFKGLLKNRDKHGEVYCPCRIVSGDKEKDKDIICPCVFHRGEIELEGKCRCLLFVENK